MNQQPEMTTIEEIVERYKNTIVWEEVDNGVSWLTQTLKDYGDAVRGETLNDVEEALKQWWGKDLEEGHAYADDYIAEGTTLSGDIIPVIRSLKGNNE